MRGNGFVTRYDIISPVSHHCDCRGYGKKLAMARIAWSVLNLKRAMGDRMLPLNKAVMNNDLELITRTCGEKGKRGPSPESFKTSPMSVKLTKILFALIFLLSVFQNTDGQFEDYCIADEQTPDDQLLAAMNWACGNGADCSAIQENQPCYLPNTPKDHASYAFNSYYQNMKHKGASCYFNAAAVLTGLNPSHNQCKFEYLP
ncbi:Glucan endo-1,3-beta-glucosidase 12 [Sesamum alatum]|uniref:Glucan endo-1,3-beta-glucosidase 12 n=1 Tax=Sesamum alatum TaxID=300844 RepID=A0AAE1YZQ7_9LAMI|nr:Glucan endo-1,3-beta-glucosidase 12 [Sesamum alatum]